MRPLTRHFRICTPLLSVVVALLASACGGDSAPPAAPSSNPPPSSSGPINVKGTEKLGWDQVGDGSGQLPAYQYLGYVDNAPQVLADAACGSTANNGAFPCTASLPKMTAGLHTLTLAAQETSGAQRISAQSAPIQINVATSTATSMVSTIVPQTPRGVTTFDGLPLVVQTLATGLKAPSAIVAAPDG
ncbi:MAG TPA: hypothetical protein VKB36_21145, partial [Vicinamibacterales bacterium]|nr:hypothetical protein [Vicinamibacterales bacterium]